MLENAKINLEAADNLSRNTNIPDGLDFSENYYKEKINKTPKFKKPSDEKRNKISYEYRLVNETINIINSIRSSLSILTYKIGDSLEKGMTDNGDDW